MSVLYSQPVGFTSLGLNAPDFRFNALWLAALYYTNTLFLIGISFLIYDFFIYPSFFFSNVTRA